MDKNNKKTAEDKHEVFISWKNAGYHPEWFFWAKVFSIITFIFFLISSCNLIINFNDFNFQLFTASVVVFLVWNIFKTAINIISKRFILLYAPNTRMEKISIHIGGDLDLNGIMLLPYLAKSDKSTAPDTINIKFPVAIMLHGYNSGRGQLNYISFALTQLGMAVISLDLRGHGESGGDRNDILFLIRDLNSILNYIYNQDFLDKERIVTIGLSLGAIISLYEGYLDPRVKCVLGLATTAEYKTMIAENIKPLSKKWWWKLNQRIGGLEVDPSSLQSRLVSPSLIANCRKSFFDVPIPWEINNEKRVLLLQCKDDYIVEEDNFERNVKAFKLTPKNYELFEKGGHGFLKQEVAVVGRIIGFLKKNNIF
ncbi:MAG: alpha/beta hydrolase family protein [Promethearchaeota archaeon]